MLIRISPPAVTAIDRQTVWSHLRAITGGEGETSPDNAPVDAAYIDMLIEAAVDRLDGPSGLLNRALISQTWAVKFARFSAEMSIPLARCQGIVSVKYGDRSGAEVVLPSSAYRAIGIGSDRCVLTAASSSSWPSGVYDADSATVTFRSGFGDAPADVPASIRLALLEAVARAYSFREDVIAGSAFSTLPGSANSAVTDWRVWPNG